MTRRLRLELSQPIKGFVVETEDGRELVCREVRGFREAMLAAYDPRAPMPSRMALVLPDTEMGEWLGELVGGQRADPPHPGHPPALRWPAGNAVATLASYGCGIDTSLGIESIAAEPAGTGVSQRRARPRLHRARGVAAAPVGLPRTARFAALRPKSK